MKREKSVDFVFNKWKFAKDVKNMRLAYGFSQDEVAREMGVTGSWISDVENAKSDNSKIGNILGVCNLFDLDPRNYLELAD